MKRIILSCCAFLAFACVVTGADRPNVLWIIADDLGPELACYKYPDVATPHLDALAAGGRRFTRAFATSPVCSSSRSAFQTGRYQTSIGCYHHLTRDKQELPADVPTCIDLMRRAGYFISHGYGVAGSTKAAKYGVNYLYDKKTHFDGRDWSARKPGQPFFAQVHIGEPHRTFVKSERPRPGAPIPPCYPEHPVTRADWANYLATIEVMDTKVGAVLDRLKAEGLFDNTLVFFFGDHGRPHVRGKQWLYEGGLHTPLIVSWPARLKGGEVKFELASLLDVMPTTLSAAGIKGPELPGMNLLADNWKGHERIFAARDRCGDAPDRIRSVRSGRFKYIRNFHPDRPYLQHSGYKKLQYPVLTLMKVMHAQGRWNTPFMASTRPAEEFYDLLADPHELKNLAEEPAYGKLLRQMRDEMDEWMRVTGDQGGVDESKTVDMDALMKGKWEAYARAMKRRGLDPNLSDREYLNWWKKELGVN